MKGKVVWVVEHDFHGNFQVNVTWLLPFYPVSLTEFCSFWYVFKDFFTVQKLGHKVVFEVVFDHLNSWLHKR